MQALYMEQICKVRGVEDMTDTPMDCPGCNDHPAFEEIADGEFQCKNCGTVQDEDGNILEEGEEGSMEENLWDDE